MDMLRHYKAEVLSSIASQVDALAKGHEEKRRPWFPSEYLREEHVFGEPSPEVIVGLVFNTLTEEGLPSFHRLLASYLGEEPHWRYWTNRWTAEEDQHSTVLYGILMRLKTVDMTSVDRMKFEYLQNGFYPPWGSDPYKLLGYTVLQEKATQVSHKNVAGKSALFDEVLPKVLGRIAREEGGHHAFYLGVFREVLARDPDEALESLVEVMYQFEMPGANIPGFKDYAYFARRAGVFSTGDYKKIVEETIEALGLYTITGLKGRGEKAREQILRFPRLLSRQAQMFNREDGRVLRFPFLPGWQKVL